ncbi:hypothetical protein J6590_026630 [Homalodisca vitripennis]|nr:hypothetical protein J6590_026630 [Homalodisca vitripennis]
MYAKWRPKFVDILAKMASRTCFVIDNERSLQDNLRGHKGMGFGVLSSIPMLIWLILNIHLTSVLPKISFREVIDDRHNLNSQPLARGLTILQLTLTLLDFRNQLSQQAMHHVNGLDRGLVNHLAIYIATLF